MKRLALLALAANGLFAATFATGQAARAVIGQPYFSTEDARSSDRILGGAGAVAYANGMLFVVDANRVSATPSNNRLLIYRNINGQVPGPGDEIPRSTVRCPLCGFQADNVLGQDDYTTSDWHLTQNGLRSPTDVATDGVRLVVADTDNNRVLIWNTIPASNNAKADIVLGQKDFGTGTGNTGTGDVRVPSASTLRSPQGVWIQNGKLFVADTQNHRVLIWNSFPTQNAQAADVVLGQKSLGQADDPETVAATASNMLNPLSVSSDGVRLFVADLGHNRVLIWNSIPTQNNQPADVEIGQPDMVSSISNNSYKVTSYDAKTGAMVREKILCDTNGTDDKGNATYPELCGRTLSFPRYVLSDGTRLFISDGGNDRVLVFNQIPTENAAKADVVLGQIADTLNQTSDSSGNTDTERHGASEAIRTPGGMAWDGTNLYIAEPFSRRINVFTPGASTTVTPVRNGASLEVYAVGSVTLGGTITVKDSVTITIEDKDYKYTVVENDTLDKIAAALANKINSANSNKGDPYVFATVIAALHEIRLTSRLPGTLGNDTTVSAAVSTNATITANASTLSGGGNAAKLAAGTLVSIFGPNLASTTASSDLYKELPLTLGGVQVYVDGRQAPVSFVSPTQVNAQIPWEVRDTTSSSLYVRTTWSDGSVTFTNAAGIPVVKENPGIFAYSGADPRPAVAYHSSSYATNTVMIDGTAVAGDIVSITIGGSRKYAYTVLGGDTLDTIRDALIAMINANDPAVTAYAGGLWDRVRLRAKVAGTAGNGIAVAVEDVGGNVVISKSKDKLCCASVAGTPVTKDNPAVNGETIYVYATGLGLINDPARFSVHTGLPYDGPELNQPVPAAFVSSLAGGSTANVLYSGMLRGAVGMYRVELELGSSLATNDETQLTIAQENFVSNIVTVPVKNTD